MVKYQGCSNHTQIRLFNHVFNLHEFPTVLTILSQIFPELPQGLLPPQIHRVLEREQPVKQKLYDDFHLPPRKRK